MFNHCLGAVDSLLDSGQVSLPWMVACNHMKSVAYFTASINSACAFKAFPCDNWTDFQDGKCLSCDGKCSEMGYNAKKHRGSKPVLAYLKTVKQAPFCGRTSIKVENCTSLEFHVCHLLLYGYVLSYKVWLLVHFARFLLVEGKVFP